MSTGPNTEPTIAGPSKTNNGAPAEATASLFVASTPVPDHFKPIRGPDFEEEQDVHSLLTAFGSIGFQATGMHKAVDIIEKMVSPLQAEVIKVDFFSRRVTHCGFRGCLYPEDMEIVG